MKTAKKQKLLFLAMAMVLSFTMCLATMVNPKNGIAQGNSINYVQSINGLLNYDSSEFELIEDTAAFVPATIKMKQVSPNGEQVMRLDTEKTGLMIKSKLTGDAVEGKSLDFANKMSGEFSIDFRVFSENSALSELGETAGAQIMAKDGHERVKADPYAFVIYASVGHARDYRQVRRFGNGYRVYDAETQLVGADASAGVHDKR